MRERRLIPELPLGNEQSPVGVPKQELGNAS
jgi:hypothetical protein